MQSVSDFVWNNQYFAYICYSVTAFVAIKYILNWWKN